VLSLCFSLALFLSLSHTQGIGMMEEEIEGGELVWSSVGVAGQEEEEEGGLRNLVQKQCR